MHRMRYLAIAAITALALAACNGGDAGGQGGGGSPDATTTLADLQGQKIEVAGKWSGSEQERFEAVLELFEQRTGAEVTFTSTGEDTAAFLGGRIEGRNPPDVAILPQPGLLEDLAKQDALQPLEDIVGQQVQQNYAPVWTELGSVDGTLYGVWFKAANKSTVWYAVPAFNDAGVQPPETWDQLKQAATTLRDSGVTPFSIAGADGWTLTDWFENVYLRTAGPQKYDQLASHEIPWTDESVKDALRTLAEVFGQEEWIAGGPRGALQTSFPESVTQVFGDQREAAIVYEGDFVAGVISAETQAQLGQDADFFMFPSIDGSQPSVVGGGDVAVLMKDSDGGKELIKFLATADAAEVWAKEGGFTSPNRNVDLNTYPNEIERRSAQALVEAETFRFDLSDLQPAAFGGTQGQGMWKILQDFLQNPDNVDAIARQLERAAERAYR